MKILIIGTHRSGTSNLMMALSEVFEFKYIPEPWNQKLNESLDKAIEREKSLNEKIDLLVKDMLIKEAKEKLTAVQCDKLDKLMESVPFVDGLKYKAKLDMYVGVVADGKQPVFESHKSDSKKLPWEK